jgi:hypothetical protein
MREKDPSFLGCPRENLRVGAPAMTSLSDAQDIHVWKRPP